MRHWKQILLWQARLALRLTWTFQYIFLTNLLSLTRHIIRVFYDCYPLTHWPATVWLCSWITPGGMVLSRSLSLGSLQIQWHFPFFFHGVSAFSGFFFHLSDYSLSLYPIPISVFYFKCKDSASLCPQPLHLTHSLIYSVSLTLGTVLGSRDTLPHRWKGTDPSNLLGWSLLGRKNQDEERIV